MIAPSIEEIMRRMRRYEGNEHHTGVEFANPRRRSRLGRPCGSAAQIDLFQLRPRLPLLPACLELGLQTGLREPSQRITEGFAQPTSPAGKAFLSLDFFASGPSLSSYTRSAPAGFIEPPSSPADKPPSGSNWTHEIKRDGYRLIPRREPVGTRL